MESPEAVTKFLEYTGEGTVQSVSVLPPKRRGSRSSAIVQFTTAECAEIIHALAVRSLKKEARTWFFEKPTSDDPSDFGTDISMYATKASAWYHVTYHHRYWGCYNKGMARDHFLSFPWCVFDILIKIKK